MKIFTPKKSWFHFLTSLVVVPGTWLIAGRWMMTHDTTTMSEWEKVVFCVLYVGVFYLELVFFTWWNAVELTKKCRKS